MTQCVDLLQVVLPPPSLKELDKVGLAVQLVVDNGVGGEGELHLAMLAREASL